MSSEPLIEQYNNHLNDLDLNSISELIHKENPDSIISSFDKNLLSKYLNKIIDCKNTFLFTGKLKNEIISYAILAEKPSYLITEFTEFRLDILKCLLIKIKIITLFNIFLKVIGLDMILVSKKNKELINENLNLNMIAVKREHQSTGIGSFFLNSIISIINGDKRHEAISLESLDKRAFNFYKIKLGFLAIGVKLRFFKNLKVQIKLLKE